MSEAAQCYVRLVGERLWPVSCMLHKGVLLGAIVCGLVFCVALVMDHGQLQRSVVLKAC